MAPPPLAALASLLSPGPARSLEMAPRPTPASTCQQSRLVSAARLPCMLLGLGSLAHALTGAQPVLLEGLG